MEWSSSAVGLSEVERSGLSEAKQSRVKERRVYV